MKDSLGPANTSPDPKRARWLRSGDLDCARRGLAPTRRCARSRHPPSPRDRPPAQLREEGSRLPRGRSRRHTALDQERPVRGPGDHAARRHGDLRGPWSRRVLWELALVSEDAVRSAAVVALEPSETYSIYHLDFVRLRERHQSVNIVLLTLLAGQVLRLSERLVEALYVEADTRVLRRVRDLSVLYGDGSGHAVIPLTQENIAELAGTSRATVNRVLREEEERGTLELGRGKTVVFDPEALSRRAR